MPDDMLTTAASTIAAPTPPNNRRGDARHRDHHDRARQHQLLPKPIAQRRRQTVADHQPRPIEAPITTPIHRLA